MNHVGNAEVLLKNTLCVLYADKQCNTSACNVVQSPKECRIPVIRMVIYANQDVP